jgi:carotenoid cleavage dioxygenase-like enzyme
MESAPSVTTEAPVKDPVKNPAEFEAEAEAEAKQAKKELDYAEKEYNRLNQLRLTDTTAAVAELFEKACCEFGRAQLAERTAYARYNDAYCACEKYYFGKN